MNRKPDFNVIVGFILNGALVLFIILFIRMYAKLQALNLDPNDKKIRSAEVLRIVSCILLPLLAVGHVVSCFLFWRLRKDK